MEHALDNEEHLIISLLKSLPHHLGKLRPNGQGEEASDKGAIYRRAKTSTRRILHACLQLNPRVGVSLIKELWASVNSFLCQAEDNEAMPEAFSAPESAEFLLGLFESGITESSPHLTAEYETIKETLLYSIQKAPLSRDNSSHLISLLRLLAALVGDDDPLCILSASKAVQASAQGPLGLGFFLLQQSFVHLFPTAEKVQQSIFWEENQLWYFVQGGLKVRCLRRHTAAGCVHSVDAVFLKTTTRLFSLFKHLSG